MVSFEDEDDPTQGIPPWERTCIVRACDADQKQTGSGEESEDEDENMADADADGDADGDGDEDGDADADGDNDMDGEGENDDDNDENDNEDDDEGDNDEPDTPSQSRRQSRASPSQADRQPNPTVLLTSPSPRPSTRHSPSTAVRALMPLTPLEALNASTYDIVPTMAAPQSTSINALTATPDMRWAFSGGADGYIRMYNWVDTANGKVPLTVAQKHPFVDSVMKAGSLTTYWENEESSGKSMIYLYRLTCAYTDEQLVRTPPAQSAEEPKDSSPVYSLAVHHQALWLLSGLESGAINLQTCRHQAGTRIATLREHTSAVSVLTLSQDETTLLSGSWDKLIHDWDLNTGKVKRSFRGSGGQISAIEQRPTSSVPIPRVAEDTQLPSSTFSSNNADKPLTNGTLPNGTVPPSERRGSKKSENGTEDAPGSPDGSLFGDDGGSLFGDNDDTGNAGGNAFGGDDDDDEFSKAIANDIQQDDEAESTANQQDIEMTHVMEGGPVQHPDPFKSDPALDVEEDAPLDTSDAAPPDAEVGLPNGLPHSEDAPTALPNGLHDTSDQPLQSSESVFLDAAIDGTLRIWDRRVSSPIARIMPPRSTPPWCMGACWSPDGNSIYAGRRNGTVEEYNIHKGFRMAEPERTFKFPAGSGAVSAVRTMPNGRHLVW